MAKVEKFTPPVVQVYRVELSEEEVKGLFTLLDDGVDGRALEQLKLNGLRNELRTQGVRSNTSVCFGYLAEID